MRIRFAVRVISKRGIASRHFFRRSEFVAEAAIDVVIGKRRVRVTTRAAQFFPFTL